MKKLITAAVLSVLATSPALAAKDPCKGVSQKKSAFGVTRSFEVGPLRATRSGDTTTINISINIGGGLGGLSGGTNTQSPTGTPVELMMEDGSSLTLNTTSDVGVAFAAIMGIVVYYVPYPIALDAEQGAALSAQPIKAARSNISGREVTAEFKGGDAKKFQETLACLLNS